MKTNMIYQQDVYTRTCSATVENVILKDDHAEIVLDQTIFFPEGGGQPSDTGWLVLESKENSKGKAKKRADKEPLHIKIAEVHEKDKVAYHRTAPFDAAGSGDMPGSGDQISPEDLPQPGDTVSCMIDWDRRFLNMQRHCGEHILSGVFADLYGGANRGFHMGESYITVDIRLENDPAFDKITWDMCMKAERRINEIVWSDLPVRIDHFSDPKEAAKMPLRKELTIEDEDISIVTIGSIDDPADCVACCGTHPARTAQVGLVKIYKVEKNKDMFRIYFDCGANALSDYDEKHRLITKIGDHYSAGLADLEKKMAADEQKNLDMRAHLNTISRSLAAMRAEDILKEAAEDPDRVVFRSYSDFTADDIMKIGKIAGPKLEKPALVLAENEHTVLFFSNGSIHCGNLVRENAGIYGGKGGGSDVQARAIFPDNKNIETFVDLIDKHLR